eukprot:PhM_4_TR5402/c0_g1_i1/m.2850/K14026/SEL1, SEL1L; SEL1 protein
MSRLVSQRVVIFSLLLLLLSLLLLPFFVQSADTVAATAAAADEDTDDTSVVPYRGADPSTNTIPAPIGRISNLTEYVDTIIHRAHDGDAQAQYILGALHNTGVGVTKDVALSVLYETFAAKAGDVDAALAMAYRHENGFGVERSCAKAVGYYWHVARSVASAHQGGVLPDVPWRRLYIDSTDQDSTREAVVQYRQLQAVEGDARAHMFLGYTYMYGLGGQPQDAVKAAKYFQKAVDSGDAAAYGALGQLCSRGTSHRPANLTAALEYFKLGAREGDISSLNGLGLHYARGIGVEANLTAAVRYFTVAAGSGNAEAHYNLGLMFLGGVGVPRDVDRARNHLTLASNHGQVMARYKLGELFYEGTGVTKSCRQAVKYFRAVALEGPRMLRLAQAHDDHEQGKYVEALVAYLLAAEGGVEVAESNAAHMLDNDHLYVLDDEVGPEARAQAAFDLYARAGKQNNRHALVRAGDFHFEGRGVEYNSDKALEFYSEAETKRSARAAYTLGWMYHWGIGVASRDLSLAKRYYDSAVAYDPETRVPVTLCLWHVQILNALGMATTGGEDDSVYAYVYNGIRVLKERIMSDVLVPHRADIERVVVWWLVVTICILVYLRTQLRR